MITGHGGLFGKTQVASSEYTIKSEKEAMKAAWLYLSLDKYGSIGNVSITAEQLQFKIKNNVTVTKEGSNFKIKFNNTGNEYIMDKRGNVVSQKITSSRNTDVGNISDTTSTPTLTPEVTATPLPTQYTIAYELNGGTANNPTYYYENSEAFTLAEPTKLGYTFVGWTGSNGDTPQTSVTIGNGSMENKMYTANWVANTYQIAFHANGGTGTMTNQTLTYDVSTSLNKNAYKYKGHSFKEWNTKEDGSGISYNNENQIENLATDGVFNLYAQWNEINASYLSANVDIGDYVNYMPKAGNCTIVKADSGLQKDETFTVDTNTKWRVFKIDEESNKVIIIPEEPISNKMLNLWGKNGYIHYTSILNTISALYGSGDGAQIARSITLADVEEYSTYDTSNYVHTGWQNNNIKIGDTNTYNEGTFINEQGIDEGKTPFTATQTQYRYQAQSYFPDNKIYNLLFKQATNTNQNKIPYFLATRCTSLYSVEVNYGVYTISNGWIESGPTGKSSNNSELFLSGSRQNSTNKTIYAYVMPLVELKEGITTTGQDDNGVWILGIN